MNSKTGCGFNASVVSRVYLYFGALTLLVHLGAGGPLLGICMSFMLKDELHAAASQVAVFGFLISLPVYHSFIFGVARDLWSPFGMRDRGYLLLFAPVVSVIFVVLAFSPPSFPSLFVGMFLAMIAFRFIFAAFTGLMALVGQERFMSGRLAALLLVVGSIPGIAGAIASGWFVEHVSPRDTFLVLAAMVLGIALVSVWKPSAVFENTYDTRLARSEPFGASVKRLLGHKAIYPAVLITFLFQFMPGVGTPLLYYLTDKLHARPAMYGYYHAIFAASLIPVFLFYGWLCRRIPVGKLLWWGTLVTIPQMIPLAFIHSGKEAMVMAVPIGLMGGIAGAAYTDLTMRSCPSGLHGTLMMLVGGVYALSTEGGNLLGTAIYSLSPKHGFLYDVIVAVLVYGTILPVLKTIPADIINTSDGERTAALAAGSNDEPSI